MSFNYYNFYCDESGIHGGGDFYIGAIYCSPERANILRSKFSEVRNQYECKKEMKWTKVSASMLEAYSAFARVFLDDLFAKFVLMRVKRGTFWRAWGPNEEERFFKTYYVFLRMNMSRYCRYAVYVDNKPSKSYRWNSLRFAIQNAAYRDYEVQKKQIYSLEAISSKEDDLLQMTDILMGSLTSNATASAKVQLSEYVSQNVNKVVPSGKPKFFIYDWQPDIRT